MTAVLMRDDFDSRTSPRRGWDFVDESPAAAPHSSTEITVSCNAFEATSNLPEAITWVATDGVREHFLSYYHSSGMTNRLILDAAGSAGAFVSLRLSNGCLINHSGVAVTNGSLMNLASDGVWPAEPSKIVCRGLTYVQGVAVALKDLLDELPIVVDRSHIAATIDQIRATLAGGKVDPEDIAMATAAADQAIAFLRRNNLPGRPRVMMTDDGVLTLQWRSETLGAALIFTGDGTVSVALKNAEKSYSETLEGIDLAAPLPPAFVSIVETISG